MRLMRVQNSFTAPDLARQTPAAKLVFILSICLNKETTVFNLQLKHVSTFSCHLPLQMSF